MVTQNTISLLPHIYCWYHVVAKVHLRWKPEENKRALNFMLFCFTAAILDYIILVCINRGYHCQIFALLICMRSVFFYWISKYIYWLNWKEKTLEFWPFPALNMLERWKVWWWYTPKGKVRNMVCIQRIKPLSFWISDKFVVSPTSLQRFWLN